MRFACVPPILLASLASIALGCAAYARPRPAPSQDAATAPPAQSEFTPIRFGDPLRGNAADADPLLASEAESLRAEIPPPAAVLDQPVGSRPAHPAEIAEYFRLLAEASPLVEVEEYGATFEGRPLLRAVLTSEQNHERLDAILDSLRRLADPRGVSSADEARLARDTPACAWLGYSIHGDEISGADASMAVAHHLVASNSPDVQALLDDLVIVIDPCMNPDGRERFVSMLEENRGYVANRDWASMQRGRWPYGRGNHYLFDMNRDWIAGVAPETRGRWRVLQEFPPQLFVDAHEMGALDTYLFYPQAPAYNPQLPSTLQKWQTAFAADQSAAFDAFGWGYYTREWADAWGPFYSDAWGSLRGAVGILYEQASTDGQPVQRESGEVVPYRVSVRKQAVSSLANLRTLRANREEVLRDWVAGKRANLEVPERWFVCRTGGNVDREDELVGVLLGQGVEVYRTSRDVTASEVEHVLGRTASDWSVPAGSLVVPARQALAPLVASYLDLDVRMGESDLLRERRELEQKGSSLIYDVTAWDLGHALALDAGWTTDASVARDLERLEAAPVRSGAVLPPADGLRRTAWAVDGRHDSALVFAVRAMELGLRVHLSDKPFTTAGTTFPSGSLLLRRHENAPEDLEQRIERAAREARVTVHATGTGRSPDEGPDLGGGHFQLLERPRVALLANSPVHSDTYGHLWYWLDRRLGVPYSLLDASSLEFYDLRRFNVIVLPPAGGSMRAILEVNADALATWVRGGGTLIACGNAASMVADEELGLSAVRLRTAVLDDEDDWAREVARERAAREVSIDPAAVWDGVMAEASEDEGEDEAPAEPATADEAWARRFAPRGVFVRGELAPHTFLTAGLAAGPAESGLAEGEALVAELPVDFVGPSVLRARAPVTTAVRLAPAPELRLAGLLWPEARERIADSSYVTREARGDGQVILFAASPGFRGYFHGTARLFANAVVYGPGAGARAPIGW